MHTCTGLDSGKIELARLNTSGLSASTDVAMRESDVLLLVFSLVDPASLELIQDKVAYLSTPRAHTKRMYSHTSLSRKMALKSHSSLLSSLLSCSCSPQQPSGSQRMR